MYLVFGILLAIFSSIFASRPFAADASPEPDISAANPALATMAKNGIKFFYLGREAGIDGWIGVKDGQIQTFYRPTNNDYVLVGYLFGPRGENLTGAQVKKLMASNKELAALTGAPPPKADAPKTDAPKTETAGAPPSAGERLLKELQENAGVTFGSNNDAPLLYAIMSPSCLDCHEFWRNAGGSLASGLLRIRLYVAGLKDSYDERIAAELLQSPDPLAAWNKYAAGDSSLLNGKAGQVALDQAALDKVRALTALIDKWRLPTAPYFLYRAKNGQVKVVQGKPSDLQAIIGDAAPEKPGVIKP